MNGNEFYATTSLTIKSSSFIINSTIDIPFINGTFTRGSNDAFNKMRSYYISTDSGISIMINYKT